jgi:hypothetical protein
VLRRQIKRRYVLVFFEKLPPCLVGIEACASAHHWSRELQALGHTVRLMPPAYVTPYVKRHKNDAIDAEAICEAVTRPHQGRRHRACQQDRPDGMGNDGQGRALQGARRACGINEIAPDNRRDVKVGRTNST